VGRGRRLGLHCYQCHAGSHSPAFSFVGDKSCNMATCIGGDEDGLTHPVPNDAETVTWPVSITGREACQRETLSLGDVGAVVYIHESLTPREALNLLVGHYKAWCVNRPGGRR